MSTSKLLLAFTAAASCYMFIYQSRFIWMVFIIGLFSHYNYCCKMFRIIQRDFDLAIKGILITIKLYHFQIANFTVYGEFLKQVQKHPQKNMIIFEHKYFWTFSDVKQYTDAIASYFHSCSLKKGDVVAVYMENVPESLMVWLGLSKLGVISSLINYNHKSAILTHSINISDAKYIICSPALATNLHDVQHELNKDVNILVLRSKAESSHLVTQYPDLILPDNPICLPNISNYNDILMFIYTSGTTGMPKAARMTNQKYIQYAYTFPHMIGIQSSDIVWAPLPIYHTNAAINGFGISIVKGSGFAFNKKFSASSFSKDLTLSNVTVCQYLGEICRYALAAKESEYDRKHKVRLMMGAGLRSEIWKQFQDRFAVPRIVETYGSTEGNVAFINLVGKSGSIGYFNSLTYYFLKLAIVKVNDSGEIIRDNKGRCINCKAHEPGMVIGLINKHEPLRKFAGYHGSEEQTSKKILQNVFKENDKYFNSGDVVQFDDEGFVYFLDRSGDTFRFKGENVSTFEVESVLSNAVHQKDLVVYGVSIPHVDGCAGMVCIAIDDLEFNLNFFTEYLLENLPSYARPVFIRLVRSLEDQVTSTFKYKKTTLRRDAFNVNLIKDKLYYFSSLSNTFKELDCTAYKAICAGEIRF